MNCRSPVDKDQLTPEQFDAAIATLITLPAHEKSQAMRYFVNKVDIVKIETNNKFHCEQARLPENYQALQMLRSEQRALNEPSLLEYLKKHKK